MSAPRECASWGARNGEAVFTEEARAAATLHGLRRRDVAVPSRGAHETDHTSRCLSGRAAGASGVAAARPGRSAGAGNVSSMTVPALLAMIAANHCMPPSVPPIMTRKCHGRRDRAAIFLEMDIRTLRHIRNYYETGRPNTATFDHKLAPNWTVNPRRSNQMT
jgi:hypothetical protein